MIDTSLRSDGNGICLFAVGEDFGMEANGGWGGAGKLADKRTGRTSQRLRKQAGLSEGESFDLEVVERERERRKLNVGEFRGAIRAGGFKAVHLVAQGPVFVIQGEPQGRQGKSAAGLAARLTLVTTRNRTVHMFPNPTRALAMLLELGVKTVQVDLDSWRPHAPTDIERRRPDMAERLQFAHAYAREGALDS